MFISELFEDSSEVETFAKQVQQKHGLHAFDLYTDQRGDIELNRIEVSKGDRKSGAGTAAMQDLIHYADMNDKLIWLSVADRNSEMGTTSRNRLYKFYRRFGFKRNAGRNKRFELSLYASMYRDPN